LISRRQISLVILSLSAISRVTGTYASWQRFLKSVVTKQLRGTVHTALSSQELRSLSITNDFFRSYIAYSIKPPFKIFTNSIPVYSEKSVIL